MQLFETSCDDYSYIHARTHTFSPVIRIEIAYVTRSSSVEEHAARRPTTCLRLAMTLNSAIACQGNVRA